MQPGPSGAAIPTLGRYAPLLALAPDRKPGLYIETIRWWASIQTLVDRDSQGIASVRRDARNDIKAHRLFHTLAQARLASIGLHLGAAAELEPAKAGGPGDVILRIGGREVFLEIVTFGPDETVEFEDMHHHAHSAHLLQLCGTRDIFWEGDVPGFLNKHDETVWYAHTEAAAAECAATGEHVEVGGKDGTCLVVRPGKPPAGARTLGPYLESNDGIRLAKIISRKGVQTRGVGVAWVWVEDRGGIHPLSPFAGMDLSAKIDAMADVARPVLAEHHHLAGIAWSSAQQYRSLPPDQQAENPVGAAVQRCLPFDHFRESLIIHRRLILPDQIRQIVRLCDAEAHWLDWALGRLGISDGYRSLLSEPRGASSSRLWTPPS
jgi:hypothetical protein